jgi:hypothetical protein
MEELSGTAEESSEMKEAADSSNIMKPVEK